MVLQGHHRHIQLEKAMSKIFVLIIFSFILTKCEKTSNNVKVVSERITMTFKKDTTGQNLYWLSEKNFGGFYFEEDIQEQLTYILIKCEDSEANRTYIKDTFSELPKTNKSFYEILEYEDNVPNDADPYTHFGGDAYYNLNGDIVLSFNIKAKVIELTKPPCHDYNFVSLYSCPIEKEKETYPMYIIIDVLKSSSLNSKILKQERMVPIEGDSFQKGLCH